MKASESLLLWRVDAPDGIEVRGTRGRRLPIAFSGVIASLLVVAFLLVMWNPADAPLGGRKEFPQVPATCNGGGLEVPDSRQASTLIPQATGTIRSLPELGILERAPVANDIQSTYFRTTDENREFRRGIFEFAIPEPTTPILFATLVLPEGGGWSATPLPPDTHVLSFYAADLSVDVSDYDRPAHLVGCFETDVNIAGERAAFDITSIVRGYAGAALGFRVQLLADPGYSQTGFLGADFQSPVSGDPVRIEIVWAR